MMILDTLYELDGLASGAGFWLKENDRAGFNDIRGSAAALVLTRAFDPSLRSLEASSVEKRKMFVDWHGMDSKAWRPEFIKRYPERELIHEEIRVVVRDLCSEYQRDISSHLVDQQAKIGEELLAKADTDPEFNGRMARSGSKIIEDQWHEYRIRYLQKQGPKLAEAIRIAVKKMDSIVRLRAKVEAAAPSRVSR